jgi:hypothetical protein
MDELLEKRLTDKIKTLEDKLQPATTPPPQSLATRVWKLIEDMQHFRAEVGPKPPWSKTDPNSTTAVALWGLKLQCGFEMYFSDRLNRIYCELGFNGFLPVMYPVPTKVQTEEELAEVTEFLRKRVTEIAVKQGGG